MESSGISVLVARAQRGDREAFGELYEQLAPKIYNHLYYRANGRTALAEDLTEDVFVKAMTKLHAYEDRGVPFSAWLHRIAANLFIDHARRPGAELVPIEDHHHLADARAGSAHDETLTHLELIGALGQLTELQRGAVTLRFLQGMSVIEAAAALGVTEDALKKLQARGLANLRRALDPSRPALLVA